MGRVLTLAAAMAYGRPIFYAPLDRHAEAEAAKRSSLFGDSLTSCQTLEHGSMC